MEDLPGDVLSNIFIRLPAKQVGLTRCVCKPLNDHLSHPSFIKSHLNSSLREKTDILVVFYTAVPFDKYDLPISAHPSQTPHLEQTDFVKLPDTYTHYGNKTYAIGSVNGLVCFAHQSEFNPTPIPVIHIWNPCISALLTLPRYNIPSPYHVFPFSARFYDFMFGFGFNPKTDDYKVVKVTVYIELATSLFGVDRVKVYRFLQVEVYSMRNDSWEVIAEKIPSCFQRIYDKNEVCLDGQDGRLHWIADIGDEGKIQAILSFDLGVETFSEISLPDYIRDYNEDRSIVLGFMAKKLCVMSHVRDGDCEVWVMKVYGVAESWMKYHVFSRNCRILNPIGYTLNNEFIFEDYAKHLVLYDPVAAKAKPFNVMANPDSRGNTKIIQYADSLVPVAPKAIFGRELIKKICVRFMIWNPLKLFYSNGENIWNDLREAYDNSTSWLLFLKRRILDR